VDSCGPLVNMVMSPFFMARFNFSISSTRATAILRHCDSGKGRGGPWTVNQRNFNSTQETYGFKSRLPD
jgi:hypothetical protein